LEGHDDSREVPRKHKTRRPERRGITRAVSPKKIGQRKKGNVPGSGTPERKADPENGSARFEVTHVTVLESAYFRVADHSFRELGRLLGIA
jgi:hypothetical protein